jgi:hypothetical protein
LISIYVYFKFIEIRVDSNVRSMLDVQTWRLGSDDGSTEQTVLNIVLCVACVLQIKTDTLPFSKTIPTTSNDMIVPLYAFECTH